MEPMVSGLITNLSEYLKFDFYLLYKKANVKGPLNSLLAIDG